MKVLKIYNQMRRDCYCDLECENCGNKRIKVTGYDDGNFWNNVIPDYKCIKCGKSTNDLDIKIKQNIQTKYPEGMQV